MRDETKRKLERQLWRDRVKWLGGALGVAVFALGGLWAMGLDATVETHQLAGVVETVGPVVGRSIRANEEGLSVDVKLGDGRLVHIMALKKTDPHVGDRVQIAEHVHGTGRVTYSWR